MLLPVLSHGWNLLCESYTTCFAPDIHLGRLPLFLWRETFLGVTPWNQSVVAKWFWKKGEASLQRTVFPTKIDSWWENTSIYRSNIPDNYRKGFSCWSKAHSYPYLLYKRMRRQFDDGLWSVLRNNEDSQFEEKLLKNCRTIDCGRVISPTRSKIYSIARIFGKGNANKRK